MTPAVFLGVLTADSPSTSELGHLPTSEKFANEQRICEENNALENFNWKGLKTLRKFLKRIEGFFDSLSHKIPD